MKKNIFCLFLNRNIYVKTEGQKNIYYFTLKNLFISSGVCHIGSPDGSQFVPKVLYLALCSDKFRSIALVNTIF